MRWSGTPSHFSLPYELLGFSDGCFLCLPDMISRCGSVVSALVGVVLLE